MKRLLTAAVAALFTTVACWVFAAGQAVAGAVPFSDPNAVGKLTLCNTLGRPLTSGSTHTLPFMWKAVGSVAAPAAYQRGGTASLFAYQPINGVNPLYWFGEQLTSSSTYTNKLRPTTKATAEDESLDSYLADYPTKWNGLVQLRLFLSAPGQATLTQPYNSAVIRVSGDTWTLVDGATDGCAAGDATSKEWQVGPKIRALGTPAPDATAVETPSNYQQRLALTEKNPNAVLPPVVRPAAKASAATSGGTGSVTQVGTDGAAVAGSGSSTRASSSALPSGSASRSGAAAASRDSSSSGGLVASIAVVVVVLLGGGTVYARRRRSVSLAAHSAFGTTRSSR